MPAQKPSPVGTAREKQRRPDVTRRALLKTTSTCALGLVVARASRAADLPGIGQDEQRKIEEALPERAFVRPIKPRRLLVFDCNVGYGGHRSIPYANAAFTQMGKKTGAFDTVVSRDPSIFKAESLRKFDAVFFNNTVGNLFEDIELRRSLVEFVYSGGGLLGVHGTSVAFTRWPGAHEDWPEFGILLGARGANHRENTEHVYVRLDDPEHPMNRAFGGKGFDYRDEFFRVHEPYSRDRVRVLLSIDTEKTDMNQGRAFGNVLRKDNDYALAWVRNYGRGRVFYCTIAHNPYVFWDSRMLKFYLAAAQFVLGDLPAPTTPSNKLTPAIRAQEKLGWRLGLETVRSPESTLFASIERAAQLGLSYMGGSSIQTVSQDMAKRFDEQLTADERRQVRLKLDSAGVRLLTCSIAKMPGDESGCRRIFEFGRKMGIEAFIATPLPERLDTLESLCDEYDIKLAIRDRRPDEILDACRGRSKRMGAYGDPGSWKRAGIEPIEAARMLGSRLITLQLYDRPSGAASGRPERLVEEIHRLGIKPTMFGVEYSRDAFGSQPEIAQYVDLFNHVSLKLAK